MGWKLLLLCICSYLLGSINFAPIVSKIFRNEDIGTKGSGNPGASNMLRTYGLKLFILTFLLDAIKGLVSSLIGFFLFGGSYYNEMALIGLYAGGFSAVVGHVFPLFRKFKGGKGMATTIGVFAVANFPLLILFAIISLLIFIKLRYMSILTLMIIVFTGIGEMIIKSIFFCPSYVVCALILITMCLCIFAHRTNFVRLAQGNENKIDFSKLLHGDETKKK